MSFAEHAEIVPGGKPFANRRRRNRLGNAQTTTDVSIIETPLTAAELRQRDRDNMGFTDYRATQRPSNRKGGFGAKAAVNITADWNDLAAAMRGLPEGEALVNVPVAAFPTDSGALVSITTISKHIVRNLWRRGVAAQIRSIPTGATVKRTNRKTGEVYDAPVYRDDVFDVQQYDAKEVLQRRAEKQAAGKLNASWAYHACTADTFGIEQA